MNKYDYVKACVEIHTIGVCLLINYSIYKVLPKAA